MSYINKTKEYIVGVKLELKKISWPSKETAMRESAVVVAVSLATALFLGSIDYILSYLIDKLLIIANL